MEFTIRCFGGAVAFGKIIHDELDDLLLPGTQLFCESVADERLNSGNLVNRDVCKRRVTVTSNRLVGVV